MIAFENIYLIGLFKICNYFSTFFKHKTKFYIDLSFLSQAYTKYVKNTCKTFFTWHQQIINQTILFHEFLSLF